MTEDGEHEDGERIDSDDGREPEEHSDDIPFSRRDVMKAAGTTTVVGVTMGGRASAVECTDDPDQWECGTFNLDETCFPDGRQSDCVAPDGEPGYCKLDSFTIGCTYTVPGTGATVTVDTEFCATLTDPNDEVCTIALKGGQDCATASDSGQVCLSDNAISHITVEYHCDECPPPEECVYSTDPADYYVDEADCETVTVCADEATSECPVTAEIQFTAVAGDSCPSKTVTLPDNGSTCADVQVDDCCEPTRVVFRDKDGNTLDTETVDVVCGYDDDGFATVAADCSSVEVCVSNTDDCPVTARLHLSGTACDRDYIDKVVETDDDPSTDDCVLFDDIPECCAPAYVELLEPDIRYPAEGVFNVGNCGYENDEIVDFTVDCDEVTVCATGVSDCPSQIVLYLGEDCDPPSIAKLVAVDDDDPDCVTFTDDEIPGCCTPQYATLEDEDGTEFDNTGPFELSGCGYDDLDTYLGDTVNCDEIDVCVTGVECDVTAVLRTIGEGCQEPEYTFTHGGTTPSGEMCHTFTLGGCCTPTHVEIKDEGGNFMEGARLPETGDLDTGELCGYDDLAFENVEFCCDEVTFDVSGIECDVDYTLSFSEGDCTAESGTLTSDDNDTTVSITWEDCCTPEKVVLTTTNGGQEIATLEPESPLNCVCESFETCRFETEETPLPALGETATFTCGDVDITVETTNVNDGEASCFEIVSVSEPLFGEIVVKGAGRHSDANTYDLDDCGQTEFTQEFCAPEAGRSGKNSAVSYWEISVCTEDITTGCVDGSVT